MSVIEKTAGKKARSKDRGDLVIDSELEATRADLLRSRHLPSKYYTSAEIYELELEKIWRKDWIVVGREEEFPNPGDYRAMNVAGEPVVITRAEDGTLNAFSNICAHRGTEVAYGEGNTKDFSCPYHAWLYGLKGELIKATRTGPIEGFDLSNCRLPEVKLDTWGGFIFINFDDSPPALTDYLDADTVRSEMDFLRMDELRLVDTYSFELDCNWKLIPENFIDVYHVEVLHKQTFGREFGTDDFEFGLTKYGWYGKYEAGTNAPDGEMFFDPIPWLDDHPSGELFAFTMFVRPHMMVFARQDHVQPVICYPLGPERTLLKVFTLLPQSSLKARAFPQKVRILHDYIKQATGEDADMLVSMQKNFKSSRFAPGPFTVLEKAIHHRLNRYLDILQGDGETL